MKKNIMVLVGGISRNSLNRRFFEAVRALDTAADTGTKLNFTVFDIASLPFYSQDLEAAPPASVLAMQQLALSSDGILIVTPEYNRSIPGVLKNALDWGSRMPRTAAEPDRPAALNIWAGKLTAIMGASPGAIGTFGAQQHLRNICSWLDMPVMNQPTVYFNASTGLMNTAGTPALDGDRLTDNSSAFLRKFLSAFASWIALFSK